LTSLIFFLRIIDFLASSVSALILLSSGIIPQLYALYNSPNPFTTISSFCKIRSYLNQTSAMSCRWLLVMACIDRCLLCSPNVRIRRFSSIRIARRIIIITITIWLILPIHILIYSDIKPPGNIACLIKNKHVAIYHRFYTMIMGALLPTIISLICCLFIRRRIRERETRLTIVCKRVYHRRKRIRDQQVLCMLLIQIAIFIISTVPFMSLNIYITLMNKTVDQKAIERFFKTLTELFIYLISLSFYSNTLVSYTFRKQVIILFKLTILCRRQQHHRQMNMNNNKLQSITG
jgi:hypothetical protein